VDVAVGVNEDIAVGINVGVLVGVAVGVGVGGLVGVDVGGLVGVGVGVGGGEPLETSKLSENSEVLPLASVAVAVT
jgi:hypothetical protein